MSKAEIRREALARQGQTFVFGNQRLQFLGDGKRAEFEEGGEGLVQKVVNEGGQLFRIKAFWEPNEYRYHRSVALAQQGLSTPGKSVADALAGAPIAVIKEMGQHTPFVIVMKNVNGASWKNLREKAIAAGRDSYPMPDWSSLEVRATWAYGLATAVLKMEERGFIHTDLSPGNIMLTPDGNTAGDMALVDFDGFVHPQWNIVDLLVRGVEGYAAPETFAGIKAFVGTDRVGMAILIQEFLITGERDISYDEVFNWAYDQQAEINSGKGESHPRFKQKWRNLAELLEATLQAKRVEDRPDPETWRRALLPLADGQKSPTQPLYINRFRIQNATPLATPISLAIDEQHNVVDLSNSQFRLHATIRRNASGQLLLQANSGFVLRVKLPDTSSWEVLKEQSIVNVVNGLVVFDPHAICPAEFKES